MLTGVPTPLNQSGECYGQRREDIAETVSTAVKADLVECSIKDYFPTKTYNYSLAVENVNQALEAAPAPSNDSMLTHRIENLMGSRPELDHTITRLQAFMRQAYTSSICLDRRILRRDEPLLRSIEASQRITWRPD